MKFLYLFLLILPTETAFAQKTIFSVHLDGGLSSFRGASAVSTAEVSTGGPFCKCGSSWPGSFGAKSAFSYGAGLTVQREFKSHIVIGMDLGYEMLRTKMEITRYQLDDMILTTNGKNVSYNHFLNLFPHIGYRIPVGQDVKISIMGGADFGIGLSSYDKLTIPEYYDKGIKTDTENIPGLDFRPRLQLQVSHGKVGFNVSYSHGVTNWMGDWIGGSPEAYMKTIRFGIQYQLN